MAKKNFTIYVDMLVFEELQDNAKRERRNQSLYLQMLIEKDNILQRTKRREAREPKHSSDDINL